MFGLAPRAAVPPEEGGEQDQRGAGGGPPRPGGPGWPERGGGGLGLRRVVLAAEHRADLEAELPGRDLPPAVLDRERRNPLLAERRRAQGDREVVQLTARQALGTVLDVAQEVAGQVSEPRWS